MNQIDFKNKQIQIIVNLINTRRFDDVLNKAKPLIKKFPKEYIFYNAAGMALINLERYSEAIRDNPHIANNWLCSSRTGHSSSYDPR